MIKNQPNVAEALFIENRKHSYAAGKIISIILIGMQIRTRFVGAAAIISGRIVAVMDVYTKDWIGAAHY